MPQIIKSITWMGFLALILFTGCIEIVEEITIHPNQSGTISYSLNTTETGGLLYGLAGIFNVSVDDVLRKESEKLIRELQAQDGISNIQYNLGGGSGDYSLKFDFNHHSHFNEAIYALNGSKKTLFAPGYIRIGKSRFKKINFSPWVKRYIEKEGIEIPSALISDNISWKSVIHTPDTIKAVKIAGKEVQKTPRETNQQFRLTEILSGRENTGIKIRY